MHVHMQMHGIKLHDSISFDSVMCMQDYLQLA
jgi:hypothetical protein